MENAAKMIRNKALSNIVPADALREVQLETLDRVSNALQNTYGPDGSTTLIRIGDETHGDAKTMYTKDGHRVLQHIQFNMPIELSILDDLKEITRNTVKKVGDGTTSAIVLSNEIFKALDKLSKIQSYSNKQIILHLQDIAWRIIEEIKTHKQECTLDTIYQIAYTSTDGNPGIAETIRSIYEEIGMGAFISVGISNNESTVIKKYDGVTINAGYATTDFINKPTEGKAEFKDPHIYIFEDPIDTPEMLNLCYKIIEDNVLNPVSKYNATFQKTQDQKAADKVLKQLKATVIFTPVLGKDIRSNMDRVLADMKAVPADRKPPLLIVTNFTDYQHIQDLALLSGAKTIKKYLDPKIQEADIKAGIAPTMDTVAKWFGGRADLVSADANVTKIINPINMYDKDGNMSNIYKGLLDSLEAQLKQLCETNVDIVAIGSLRKRIQGLKCNLVDYLVGGVSYTDRDATKDAVEDAILNCRNAAEYGVGYGANFEGLRAVWNLLHTEGEFDYIDKDILHSIYDAYINTISLIYKTFAKSVTSDDTAEEDITERTRRLVKGFVAEGKPLNIYNDDGDVLTSIMTDQVILNAIVKIVGMMFKSNQFLCSNVQFNKYVME